MLLWCSQDSATCSGDGYSNGTGSYDSHGSYGSYGSYGYDGSFEEFQWLCRKKLGALGHHDVTIHAMPTKSPLCFQDVDVTHGGFPSCRELSATSVALAMANQRANGLPAVDVWLFHAVKGAQGSALVPQQCSASVAPTR